MRSHNEIREFLEEKEPAGELGWSHFVFRFGCISKDEGHSHSDTLEYAQLNFEKSDFGAFDIRKTINLAYQVQKAEKNHEGVSNLIKGVNGDITYIEKQMDQDDLAFWQQYGISEKILKRFNVISVISYQFGEKTIYSSPGDPIFAFRVKSSGSLKIYRPHNYKFKYRWLGQKPENYLFGFELLPSQGDLVIMTFLELETVILNSRGYNAFTIDLNKPMFTRKFYEELNGRFQQMLIFVGNDDLLIRRSIEISKKYKIPRISFPELRGCEDISDFFFEGNNAEDLNKLITDAKKVEEEEDFEESELPDQNEGKIILTARELLELGSQGPQYLLEFILQRIGTGVLAGKPDTGKSQIARQLTIYVALGKDEFLGLKLHLRHKKAIYVATEDGIEAMSYLLSQQLKGMRQQANDNLRFLFADSLDQEELVNTLNLMLMEQPVDLIVIDSFGDIFVGKDNNNNMAMRATVKVFDRIAQKHQCLILFVHHINKNAYYLKPGQQHIQGGAGLVQKVRSALQLSEGEYDVRYLTVVKGNYCPREYKTNAMELEFSESSFLFTPTGKRVPVEDLGDQSIAPKAKSHQKEDLYKVAKEIFDNQVKTYNSFVEEYCQKTGRSEPTAKRKIAKMKDESIVVECEGGYRLKDFSPIIINQSTILQPIADDSDNF